MRLEVICLSVGGIDGSIPVLLWTSGEETDRQRNAGEDRQGISNGLGTFYAGHSEKAGKDDNGRQEVEAGAKGCRKGGNPALADTLKQHVGNHRKRLQHNGKALEAQGHFSDGNHLRVTFLEDTDQLRCVEKDHSGKKAQDHKATQQGKAIAGTDPTILFGAVVVGGHRLKALTDTDHDGTDEHNDTTGDGHGGYDRVPEGVSGNIQSHGGDRIQNLPHQRGKSVL